MQTRTLTIINALLCFLIKILIKPILRIIGNTQAAMLVKIRRTVASKSQLIVDPKWNSFENWCCNSQSIWFCSFKIFMGIFSGVCWKLWGLLKWPPLRCDATRITSTRMVTYYEHEKRPKWVQKWHFCLTFSCRQAEIGRLFPAKSTRRLGMSNRFIFHKVKLSWIEVIFHVFVCSLELFYSRWRYFARTLSSLPSYTFSTPFLSQPKRGLSLQYKDSSVNRDVNIFQLRQRQWQFKHFVSNHQRNVSQPNF